MTDEIFEEENETPEDDRSEPESFEEDTSSEESYEEPETSEEEPEDDRLFEEPDDNTSGGYDDDEGYEESEDSYIEESDSSWFSRLGSAITGVLIGLVIFAAGFPVLFINEGHSVKRYRSLKEGAGSVVSVSADHTDPANEGKLVHMSGMTVSDEILKDGDGSAAIRQAVIVSPATPDPQNEGKTVQVTGIIKPGSPLTDADFGFSINALRLERRVMMYQWREISKDSGKTVSHEKVWSGSRIDSDGFRQKKGHENPRSLPYTGETQTARRVLLGGFELAPPVAEAVGEMKIQKFKQIPNDLPQALQGKVQLDDGRLYIGKDPKNPQVGDSRIEYLAVRPQEASLTAQQSGNRLVPGTGPDGQPFFRVSQVMAGMPENTPAASGISVSALRLRRQVQMYQWTENSETVKEKKIGGGEKTVTRYSYKKIWSDNVIDSSRFKKPDSHTNPQSIPWESRTITAAHVRLGAFELPERLVNQLNHFEPLAVKSPPTHLPEPLQIHARLVENGYYVGRNPQTPQIGDLRISYSIVKPTEVSLIAAQSGNSFVPYKTVDDGTIEEFTTGIHTAQDMFKSAQSRNTLLTWLLRLAGLVVMFIGLSMIFRPISVVMDVIPFLGNLAEKGIGIVAFLLASGFALMTIAIAWFYYRPMLSIGLIVGAVVLFFGIKALKGRKKAPKPRKKAVPPPPPPAR